MSKSQSTRRSALAVASVLFAVVLLTSASEAWAQDITYTFMNYPDSQQDNLNGAEGAIGGGTDNISGTIVTDGTMGYLLGPQSDIVGGSITLENSNGTLTMPIDPNASNIGGIFATPTQLLLYSPSPLSGQPNKGVIACEPSGYPGVDLPWINLLWERINPAADNDWLFFASDNAQGHRWADADNSISSALSGDPNAINSNDPWIIATAVPEPATLTLLGPALLGVGVVYLRRRRAKA